MNGFVVGLVVSTIAYFIAAHYIKRYLDEIGIEKSMARSLVIFVLAAGVAYGVGFLIDWVASAAAQPDIRESAPASHRLDLTLVNIEASGWTRERALDALRETGPILRQCGIALGDVEWLSLSMPPRFLDFSTPVARELVRLHPVKRPAIYFVRDTRSRPAFDAEAIGRGNSRSRPELADTVWITTAARDPGVVLAHELAHVLMDSGEHADEPGNLMRDRTDPGSTHLSARQCIRLRETAAGNGLMQPLQQ